MDAVVGPGALRRSMTQTWSNTILRFEEVSKSFQGQVVLKDLSLDMGQGEFLTLLGPSGCGKTTSLNLVAGLLQPDRGVLYLRGHPANTLAPRRRGLGLVFQSWALFPHLNVFDNVAYGLKVRSVPKAEIVKRVGEMLDLVRLPGKRTEVSLTTIGGHAATGRARARARDATGSPALGRALVQSRCCPA